MALILEISLGLVALIVAIIGFYMKRLYHTVDKNTENIRGMEKELTDHRIHGASNFVSRTELDSKIFELKTDIRGMISASTHQIESIIRDARK